MTNTASLSTATIARILFETDPMRTACYENDCFDEYARIAQDLTNELAAGTALAPALVKVLSEWFTPDLVESMSLQASIVALQSPESHR